MELTGICPGGKPGDAVDFLEQFVDDATGIFALTQHFNLCGQPGQCIFGLSNRVVRVVLALTLETGVMFSQFLPVEIRQALTGCIPQRHLMTWRNTVR